MPKLITSGLVLLIAVLSVSVFAQPNAPEASEDGAEQLVNAALNGDLVAVQAALDKGVDVNALHAVSRMTAIGAAAGFHHVEVVELLLKKGADPDLGSVPALYHASLRGYPDLVRTLLAANADPNVTVVDGGTPLRAAAWKGQFEIVKELVRAGADIKHTNKNSETAADAARAKGHMEIADWLDKQPATQPSGAETQPAS